MSIGFGREESHLINCAMKKMAEAKQVEKVRFWGKILTQSKDYFIFEGRTKESNAGEAK